MKTKLTYKSSFKNAFKVNWIIIITLFLGACNVPKNSGRSAKTQMPDSFIGSVDTINSVFLDWRTYFSDDNLIALIDTALINNQELNIFLQEIEIHQNEIKARKGEYLPFIGLGGGAETERAGRYTRNGAVDEQLDIRNGTAFPSPLSDYVLGAYATWEIDIWKKLRNAKKSAVFRYLASVEGKNFLVTNLVAEVANSYYELMALDNLLQIIEQNIEIQSNALNIVTQQKSAAKVSQLAVNRFKAQLLNTQNMQYSIRQKMVEAENRINFLTGRYPKPIVRDPKLFNELNIQEIKEGVPSQLLVNRADVRQAEFELAAANLDIRVARANFYPSLGIKAGLGFNAFNPKYLLNPESITYNIVGDVMAPLINRLAIKASYNNANAQQVQAVYKYEQTILNAYVDVLNQLSKIENFSKSHETKSMEVEILMESVKIANSLFNSARADYAEVLFTQREALEAKMDLIEIKMKQIDAKINVYRALGGGWK